MKYLQVLVREWLLFLSKVSDKSEVVGFFTGWFDMELPYRVKLPNCNYSYSVYIPVGIPLQNIFAMRDHLPLSSPIVMKFWNNPSPSKANFSGVPRVYIRNSCFLPHPILIYLCLACSELILERVRATGLYLGMLG